MDSTKLRFYRVYAPSLLRFKMHPREIKLEGDTPNPEFGWIPFNHFFTRGSFLPFFLYSRLTLNLVHKFRNMIVFRSRNFTYKSLTPLSLSSPLLSTSREHYNHSNFGSVSKIPDSTPADSMRLRVNIWILEWRVAFVPDFSIFFLSHSSL